MDREKLLQNPLPINRTAYRVVKKAKPEECWRPMPAMAAQHSYSRNVLATKPLPVGAQYELRAVIGRRRGRLLVMGYAADQKAANGPAKWVVRCDCGNYEHRTKILRWLNTEADDMCAECVNRMHKLHGEWRPRDKAERRPVSLDGFIASVYQNIEKCAQPK